jgi:pimeloyl-ACP methyl ester carboxylesterase
MPGQTFATVGGARIRYRLLGAERPGVTVVFLSGLNGSIERNVSMTLKHLLS